MPHEDQSILDELRRLAELAIEQAASGDFGDARDTFRGAALICQGVDWMQREMAAS